MTNISKENMSREVINKVVNKVGEFHPLEAEFQEVIDENFDDLLCPGDHLKDHGHDRQMPKIYTSYYSNPYLREISQDELVRISISLYPPKGWMEKGKLHYYPLCPSPEIFKHVKSTGDQKTYVKELLDHLNQFDARFVYDALMEMSGGKPVVLLCYERPQPTVGNYIYCHRQIVSQWFGANLGIVVPELTRKHVSDLLRKSDEEISLF